MKRAKAKTHLITQLGWAPTPVADLAELDFSGVERDILPLVRLLYNYSYGKSTQLRARTLWSCGGHDKDGNKPLVIIGAENWGDMVALVGAATAAVHGPLRYFDFVPRGVVKLGLKGAYPQARFFCVLGFENKDAVRKAPAKMVWRRKPGHRIYRAEEVP